jgi:hypothetical protein
VEGGPEMADIITEEEFVLQSFYGGPGTFRDYRLRHLPTGMQWDFPGRAGVTSYQKIQELFDLATLELMALGWEASEDWQRQMDEPAE